MSKPEYDENITQVFQGTKLKKAVHFDLPVDDSDYPRRFCHCPESTCSLTQYQITNIRTATDAQLN